MTLLKWPRAEGKNREFSALGRKRVLLDHRFNIWSQRRTSSQGGFEGGRRLKKIRALIGDRMRKPRKGKATKSAKGKRA